MKYAIDPGHGGSDPGAVGKGGLKESVVNLAVSKLLGQKLMAAGHSIMMTRDLEVFIVLSTRAKIANDWGANFFVSVHCNSDGPSAEGIETLYKTEKGKQLGDPVQKAMITATGEKDRGLKLRNDLAVLNLTSMPACLVEIGFISHPATEEKLRTGSYQAMIANAICAGLIGSAPPAPIDPPPTPSLSLEERIERLEKKVFGD